MEDETGERRIAGRGKMEDETGERRIAGREEMEDETGERRIVGRGEMEDETEERRIAGRGEMEDETGERRIAGRGKMEDETGERRVALPSVSTRRTHFRKILISQLVTGLNRFFSEIRGDGLLSNLADICASVQFTILHHLSRRLQRALLFCEMRELLPPQKTLVRTMGTRRNGFRLLGWCCGHKRSRDWS